MPVYTITLTDVEQKCMEYISTDVNFWIQNAVHERARIAMEELVTNTINTKLAAGEAVYGTKEEIAMASTLPNAIARNEAALANVLQLPQ